MILLVFFNLNDVLWCRKRWDVFALVLCILVLGFSVLCTGLGSCRSKWPQLALREVFQELAGPEPVTNVLALVAEITGECFKRQTITMFLGRLLAFGLVHQRTKGFISERALKRMQRLLKFCSRKAFIFLSWQGQELFVRICLRENNFLVEKWINTSNSTGTLLLVDFGSLLVKIYNLEKKYFHEKSTSFCICCCPTVNIHLRINVKNHAGCFWRSISTFLPVDDCSRIVLCSLRRDKAHPNLPACSTSMLNLGTLPSHFYPSQIIFSHPLAAL